MSWLDHELVPYILVTIKGLIFLISILFFVSGIDDFFIDLCYLRRSLSRRLFKKYRSLSEEELLRPPEKRIAVMVPAWREADVIRQMLENNLKRINYSNYHFFVGTYPNDSATQAEVNAVSKWSPQVHRIVCPNPGPTNKSDCLNWVLRGIQRYEQEHSLRFEIFVMSDAEDVAHPLALRLFNYLVPRFDMVQLPVIPLEPEWHQLISGHYLDEFAETHSKDLLMRERLARGIPSAGVGTGFSRRTISLLARDQNNMVFNTKSLTEDYHLGLTLWKYGLKQIFVKQGIDRVVTKTSLWSGKLKEVKVREYIAIREYFPAKFRAAVRQKARWIVGISLQSWKDLGWFGNFWSKYFLFRDRKALLNNPATAICYIFVGIELFLRCRARLFPEAYEYLSLVASQSWLWYVLLANTFFLAERLAQRIFWVHRLYGWQQALLAIPRLFLANVINFMATVRAVKLYARNLWTGQRIVWEKTAHVYPSAPQIPGYHRPLGEILLGWRLLRFAKHDEALIPKTSHPEQVPTVLRYVQDRLQVFLHSQEIESSRPQPAQQTLS